MCLNLLIIIITMHSLVKLSLSDYGAVLNHLPPVIFVPGDGGSRLEAKLNKTNTVHFECTKTTKDFYTIWLSLKTIFAIDCWADNIKLDFDENLNESINRPGVEIRVPGFGDPSVVEYLDPKFHLVITGYFNEISNSLKSIGYEPLKNLHGAPYDFRRGPSQLNNFFENLTNLIETTFENNGDSPVVLVAHSMGASLSLILMHWKTQEWKDKYIRSIISLSGAFGGAMDALKTYAAGDHVASFVDDLLLRDVLASMPSSAFLIPNKQLWGDEVLVSTPDMNYTLDDLEIFMKDIGHPNAWKMYLKEKIYLENLNPPGVEVHCLYGQGLSTTKQLIYRSNHFPDKPLSTYEDGDGTVNIRSLRVCEKWNNSQQKIVQSQGFNGVSHDKILKAPDVINYIIEKIIMWSNVK